jgi:flagellar biosynthesis chaperone FliJ
MKKPKMKREMNAIAVRKDLNKREQKKMDEMGVMQFNLRPQH